MLAPTNIMVYFGILIVSILAFFVWNKRGVEKIQKEVEEVNRAHEQIGYPKLEKEIQFRIMETGDLTPIAELIPELKSKGIPIKLLKHYIKVSKEEFKQYLTESNFIHNHRIESASNPLQDGIWLSAKGGKLRIIDQERGHIDREWVVQNEKEAVDVYADLLWEKINY
jgi:hypothetical protein